MKAHDNELESIKVSSWNEVYCHRYLKFDTTCFASRQVSSKQQLPLLAAPTGTRSQTPQRHAHPVPIRDFSNAMMSLTTIYTTSKPPNHHPFSNQAQAATPSHLAIPACIPLGLPCGSPPGLCIPPGPEDPTRGICGVALELLLGGLGCCCIPMLMPATLAI